MKFLGLLLSVLYFLLHSSCHKCSGGCDIIFTVNGATLDISDTIVSLNKAESIVTIAIDPVVEKHAGSRDCKYENKISCKEDGLDMKQLSVYCNKELVLRGISYPVNTDLLNFPELLSTSATLPGSLPFIVLNTNPDFPKGRYHFLLQGKTNEGKEVEDIGVIVWE